MDSYDDPYEGRPARRPGDGPPSGGNFSRSGVCVRHVLMPEAVPTILALLIVTAFALALWLMAAGRLNVAGLAFLSASILIYLRERWRRQNAA